MVVKVIKEKQRSFKIYVKSKKSVIKLKTKLVGQVISLQSAQQRRHNKSTRLCKENNVWCKAG